MPWYKIHGPLYWTAEQSGQQWYSSLHYYRCALGSGFVAPLLLTARLDVNYNWTKNFRPTKVRIKRDVVGTGDTRITIKATDGSYWIQNAQWNAAFYQYGCDLGDDYLETNLDPGFQSADISEFWFYPHISIDWGGLCELEFWTDDDHTFPIEPDDTDDEIVQSTEPVCPFITFPSMGQVQ